MNLLDLYEQREPYQQAIDKLEQHRIDTLNDRMQELLARARNAKPEVKAALKREFEKIKTERDSYYKIREAQKGQDVVDRAAKMKALQPAQPGIRGAVKDVAQGLKNFLQGKPETGPTYEAQKKSPETVDEHGGGIGPSQRWQDLMPEGFQDFKKYEPTWVFVDGRPWKRFDTFPHAQAVRQKMMAKFQKQGIKKEVTLLVGEKPEIDEDLKKSARAAALAACIAAGGTLSGCATNPSVGGAIGTVRDVGTAVNTASKMTRAGVQDELSQELRNFIRAQGGDPGSQNLSHLYKLQKRMQGKSDQAKPINEIKDTEAVEQAILKRIMVAHKNLLMKYGPEKIMTAASDVAYDVGDIGEMGSSDISGWVRQVEYILGARP